MTLAVSSMNEWIVLTDYICLWLYRCTCESILRGAREHVMAAIVFAWHNPQFKYVFNAYAFECGASRLQLIDWTLDSVRPWTNRSCALSRFIITHIYLLLLLYDILRYRIRWDMPQMGFFFFTTGCNLHSQRLSDCLQWYESLNFSSHKSNTWHR